MKTRAQVIKALRELNSQWDDPSLTLLEQNNLDSGAVVLLWILEQDASIRSHARDSGHLDHKSVRAAVMEFLLKELL